MQPPNAPSARSQTPDKYTPFQFGREQKIATKKIRISKVDIRTPFGLSAQATAQGASGNGTTSIFQTTLTPQPPHNNEMNFAIPYVAIYWNHSGQGVWQIWPYQGGSITNGTSFSITAGYDWHNFSIQTPGSVIASFSGIITNNNMGNGTIQLVTQWQYANFNYGTANQTA